MDVSSRQLKVPGFTHYSSSGGSITSNVPGPLELIATTTEAYVPPRMQGTAKETEAPLSLLVFGAAVILYAVDYLRREFGRRSNNN
jgi:hypothetical protein